MARHKPLIDLVVRRPRAVLVLAAVLTALAVWLGSGVELRTSRHQLVPADDPNQQRFIELMAEFTGHQPLLAVIEMMGLENGRQSGLLPAAADAL
ncbi:MAG: hypothetical protein JSV80_17160, partial [Acidobacteriota bacterium]